MAEIIDIVRPGDVISSDLLNRMIALLNKHAELLAGGGPLDIDFVQPTVLRMGEELKVFGKGLEVGTLKRITVEGTDVPLYAVNPGSTDGLLAFNVPPILGIPDTGKTVVLTIENKAGVSDFASFYLLPGVATNLQATFGITRTTVMLAGTNTPAGALAADTDYDFTFSIEAFTSRDETYLLEPKVLNAASGWTVAVKGASEILIPKSQPTSSTRAVVLLVHTGAAGGADLTLGLRAKNFAGVTGSSMSESLSIASPPPTPNTDVEFLSPTVIPSTQKFTDGSLYIKIDTFDVTKQKAIFSPLHVRLKQGGKYAISSFVSNPNWAIAIINSPPELNTTGTPNATVDVKFSVTAQAGAADADAEIRIVGAGALPQGTFKFKTKLRIDPSIPNPL
jgi:hypothetical protein